MDLFSWGAILGWLCGLAADCLKAVIQQRILRKIGIETNGPPSPADTLPAAPPPPTPEPVSLARQLQDAVARYRRGEPS
jgi:hypothetical protein